MKTFIVGLLVFFFFFSIGIILARHKPLWNDELYGQQETVERTTWPNIISGHPTEWNNFPLYHALQKGCLQLFGYQLAFVWDGAWFVADPHAQLVLRVLPDFLISFAMTVIVLFFASRSGFTVGIMAFFICLSMPMVWLYWVEARSYSLWFMLTVLHSLLFLDTASKKGGHLPAVPLALVHTGLCLTAPLGIVQTTIGLGLLWCWGVKPIKFYVMTGIVPILLGAYYFIIQNRIGTFPAVSWQDLFFYNFPPEALVFLGMYVIFLFLLKGLIPTSSQGRVFLPFCLSFVALALAGIFYVVCKPAPHAAPVVPRHFIFLTPISIIMTIAIFSDLWLTAAKCVWWRLGLLIVFAAGLLGQYLSVFVMINKLGIYF